MRTRLSAESVHGEFVRQIEDVSGQALLACNQCGKCSSGCPVAFALDVLPNQIIRMAQLGLEDVLQAQTIWTCASCMTCLSRCPKGVDVPRVMEALRQMAMDRGATPMYAAELRPDLVTDAPQMAIIGGFIEG